MLQYIDVTGKTEDEAIEKALIQLVMDRDEVSVEILERAKSGFLGIGASPALVRVSYDDGRPEPEPEPVEFRPEQRKSKEEREREEAEARAEKARRAEEAKKSAPRTEQPKDFRPEVLQRDKKSEKSEKSERSPRPEKAEKPRRERQQPERRVTAGEPGEESHDEKAEQIRSFLTGLLEHMESEARVRVYEEEKGRYKVFLEGDRPGALIGRRGETLDAIQQLTSYAVNRSGEKNRVRVQVDAENYREKREQSLQRLAEKTAAKALKFRRNVTLEPMNAYERHVIHTALQDTRDISTFSIGTEPNRRVVVAYDRNREVK